MGAGTASAFYRREPGVQSRTPSLPLLLECGLETRSELWLEQERTRFFPGEHELPVPHGQQPGDSAGRQGPWWAGLMSLGLVCLPLVTVAGSWDSGDSFLALRCALP